MASYLSSAFEVAQDQQVSWTVLFILGKGATKEDNVTDQISCFLNRNPYS